MCGWPGIDKSLAFLTDQRVVALQQSIAAVNAPSHPSQPRAVLSYVLLLSSASQSSAPLQKVSPQTCIVFGMLCFLFPANIKFILTQVVLDVTSN